MQAHEVPDMSDLTEQDAETLRRLTAAELRVSVLAVWNDDHLPCVAADINGVRVSFWWISPQEVGAFHYAVDSPTARDVVIELIHQGDGG